jgi:hypothetical protein
MNKNNVQAKYNKIEKKTNATEANRIIASEKSSRINTKPKYNLNIIP